VQNLSISPPSPPVDAVAVAAAIVAGARAQEEREPRRGRGEGSRFRDAPAQAVLAAFLSSVRRFVGEEEQEKEMEELRANAYVCV
jgi:hypothetical protein